MRRFAAVFLLALMAAVVPQAGGQEEPQQQPSVSIRLLDAPEERRDDPLARVYIVDHLQPGDRIERRVELGFDGPDPIDIEVYVAPARIENGEFEFGDRGQESDITDWSEVTPPKVTIPGNGTVTATVTIAVPEDATDGERYGVVWAELPGSGGTTNIINRVGVRIYLSVGDGEEPATDFEIAALTAARDKEGRPVVETAVRNTGGRAINLSGELVLEDGPGGLTTQPKKLELGTTLAPGDSAPTVAVLDKGLPNGPWSATVTIRAGRVEKSATGTITFPDEADTRSEAVEVDDDAAQRKILGPIAAVLIAVALAAAVLAARRLRFRHRRPR